MAAARPSRLRRLGSELLIFGAVMLLAVAALQLLLALRVVAMVWIDPSSTAFQRSQIARLLVRDGHLAWHQAWQPLERLGSALPRAVLASEDAGFFQHRGIDWEAVQRARQRNALGVRAGGSTITQQLAKNLFLSGERTLLRKGQEAVIAVTLDAVLDKHRILEIYLNSVEWGEGVFGAAAASAHYYRKPPQQLQTEQAARLAVMLPAPRRFEQRPDSPYLARQAQVIAARSAQVPWPARTAPQPAPATRRPSKEPHVRP